MYKKLPDDPFFESIDDITRLWLFHSWQQDIIDSAEADKNTAILTGSFTNPEAAKKMLNLGSSTYESSDDEFEKSLEMVKNAPIIPLIDDTVDNTVKRRKRRKLKNVTT